MRPLIGTLLFRFANSLLFTTLTLFALGDAARAQFSTHQRSQPGGLPNGKGSLLKVPKGFANADQNPSTDAPHPAIVRVECKGNGSIARGSGTLIGVDDEHGYVLSNWHVVNETTGPITVSFPSGFESAATVLKTDEQWDLALLAIWQPPTAPMPLSSTLPAPGDPLIIAGYGQGPFKAVLGTCSDYVSPSSNAPFEMIEVTAEARQGDSGGPIMNQAGQLSGVLFGAGNGKTTGSHIGRVREFLDSAIAQPGRESESLATNLPNVTPMNDTYTSFDPTPSSTPLPEYGMSDPYASGIQPAMRAANPGGEYSNSYGEYQPNSTFHVYKPTNPMMPFFLVVGGVAALLMMVPK